MNKRKIDWNEVLLCGIIFASIGAIFVVVGAVLGVNMESVTGNTNARGDDMFLTLMFGGMGGLFLVMGLAFIVSQVKKAKRINRIIDEGNYVWATVAGVQQNYNVTISGRHPSILECHYKDEMTGRIYTFNSRNIRSYPTELIGTNIKVYVERGNYNNYYVDVESVLAGA